MKKKGENMSKFVCIMPWEVGMMSYDTNEGSITIGMKDVNIEIADRNLEYFEHLVKCIEDDTIMTIDLEEKLEKPILDYRYINCTAIFKKHIYCIEYDIKEGGLMNVITDTGSLVADEYSVDEYMELIEKLKTDNYILMKNQRAQDVEVPDFSKVKKLKNK